MKKLGHVGRFGIQLRDIGDHPNSQIYMMSFRLFGSQIITHNMLATTFHNILGEDICE